MQKVITFGEVLLRLSTTDNQLFDQSSALLMHYGSSEVNVAIGLAKMGVPSVMVTRLPKHDIATSAIRTLKRNGVDTQHIAIGEGRMGVYYLEQGSAIRGSQVIYDRENSSFSNIRRGDIDWKRIFDGATWFHVSGISAAISNSAAEACLEAVEVARAMGLNVSIDLNFRKNLWKYGKKPSDIMPGMVKHANVLLGDPATVNLMLGTNVPVEDYYGSYLDLAESYRVLQEVFPNLHYMGMTLRDVKSATSNSIGGALYHDGKMYGSRKIEVEPITERIGGGDAFMAGLIYGLIQGRSLQYTIDYATMASALKMTIPGDYSLFSAEAIEESMASDSKGKVSR